MDRPVRRTAEEAKAAILEVAERHLAEGGPAAVRVQKIGAELGLTDAAIHYHFGNRDGLMRALLHHAGRKLKKAFQGAPKGDGPHLLEDIVGSLDDTYRRKGHARLAMWLALEGWRSQGSGMFRPITERLHTARPAEAEIDDTAMAVAALNVFMIGDALAGGDMLAGAGLSIDRRTRERLRGFVTAMFAQSLGLDASPRRRVAQGKPLAMRRRKRA